jgi:hypothetical protein
MPPPRGAPAARKCGVFDSGASLDILDRRDELIVLIISK